MKKIFQKDQNFEDLKQLQFMSEKILQFSFQMVKKYVQTLISVHDNINNFKEVIKILHKQNKCSIHSLKYLIFLKFAIHQNLKNQSLSLENLIFEQINKIIALENKRLEQMKAGKKQTKGFSIDKAASWVRETLSRSKDKNDSRINRTMSQNSNMKQKKNQTSLNGETPKNKMEPAEIAQVKNKEQILISKINIPFATYLLKLNVCQTNFEKAANSLNLKTEQIWKIINLLKYLTKVSNCFTMVMRYYGDYYQDVIRTMLKSVDFQVKNLYPLVCKSLTTKLQLIKKQTLQIYENSQNQRKKTSLLEEIAYKFELNQFKGMVEEVAIINQEILTIYLGKYTYYIAKALNIFQPPLLARNGNQFDIVYDVLKEVERSKSQAKRLSNSKQKRDSMNESSKLSLNLKPKTSTQTEMTPAKSTFAQKKLKIVADGSRKTSIPSSIPSEVVSCPVIENEGSTFRRMRLNMTSQSIHLQDSNTRRLRL